MSAKKRIISCALTSVLAFTSVGALVGCDALTGENVIWIAFAETGYGRAFLEQWCKDFQEKYPNEEYVFELEGEPGMTAEIQTRLTTDNEIPDLFFSLDTNWQEWAARGYLHPLDDIYQEEADDDNTIWEFMNEGLRDYGVVNGHYYVIPWTDGANGIIYNYNMFEENGWEVPTTVEELYALCETINALPCNNDDSDDNDIAPFAWSGTVASYWDFLVENWWAQYEGQENFDAFFDYETPKVYAQGGRVKALEVFKNLIVNEGSSFPKNSIPGAVGATYTISQLTFINGKAAMMPNGPWLEQEMKEVMPDGFEMRLMQTPYLSEAQTDENGEYIPINASSAGDFFCIPKNAPNLEAALEFMKYINSREACETYTRITGGLRPFQYVDDLDLETLEISDFAKSCIEVYQNSITVYHYSNNPMQWINKLGKWPDTGAPYVAMISDPENNTPAAMCSKCCDYAYREWWNIYNLVNQ